MRTPTQQQIRSAFRGATKSEISKVTFPLDFDDIDFTHREFYGWRDRKIPRRAYLVVEHDDELVTLMLNRSEAKPRRRAMCSWCRDVELMADVLLYSVRRAGSRGRHGDTLAVLVCEDFGCPQRARKLPPAYHKGTDLDAVRAEQVAEMSRRVHAFVSEFLSTDD
ncbi:FBP domain-containing protein [Gordonia sp. MP11Mi]|uniref:Elongation factor G-binding protein C-terminal treble-clef zinc-finger domain-containing protein n=1 Tax=Gordonia sp. MP11Mi TaxID=3022769 RepID=A0AA97CW66_9ACTN